jgi:hypothetical protein
VLVACRADSPYRADDPVVVEGPEELPGPELRSAIAVQNAPVDVSTPGNSVVEGCDGQAGLHPCVDRVSDDPLAEDVLDRAEIQLAFAGGVFGDVGEPQPVGAIRGEVTADQVVMHRRAGLLLSAALLAEHAPPVVVPADPPRGPVGHAGSRAAGLVGQEPLAELRILSVRVEQRVRACGPLELGIGHGTFEPAVVGLAGEFQDPARDRDGDSARGQFFHERVDPFPGRCACER